MLQEPKNRQATLSTIIGQPTPRSEGPEKVSGTAIYATDVVLTQMLWGKVLRSLVPYGLIKSIDTSRALALRGVHAVATGEDVKGVLIGRKIYDMPILADGVVRFIGEKVAAVAAESEELAEEALGLIEVDYEEMPPVLDPLEAMKPQAPLLHPNVMNYRGLLHPIERPSNVFFHRSWGKGDLEAGFREAEVVVENTFTTRPVHQAYIEPHSCVVQANKGTRADVWACSKVPFALREQLATAFGKDLNSFVIHPVYIGGCFGGKGDFMDVPVCYVLSLKTGRPVKMVMDYSEEFIAANPRHGAQIRVRTGATKDGRVVAHQMEHLFDSGAYAAFKPQGYLVGPKESAGPYRIPNVLIEEKIVYTNKVPCGHMRAPGDPQGFFANESQMDLVARKLGMDPVAFRRKNFMQDGDISPIGERVPHIRASEILASATAAAGYTRPKNKHAGRGVAIAQWLPLGGECHAFVTVDERGIVTISTAMLDQGAGTHTSMRLIAAEELKLPVEKVRVETLHTNQVNPDTGVGASRATRIFGHATLLAATDAREQLLETASAILRISKEELRVIGDGAVRANNGKAIHYSEIVKASGSPVSGHGSYKNFDPGPEASVCAQVAEVEVDVETGQVRVIQFTTAHSTGTVLNPLMHQGQIDGGVVMGIGYALMEGISIEGAKVLTTNFGDNKIPTIQDIPQLRTVVQELPVGNGPYGAMSIGEPPLVPVAAAIANAVHDATGVRIFDLPITPERILNALKARVNDRSAHGARRKDRDRRGRIGGRES